jgi:flagellar biosynthesis protein FlhF
MRLERVIAKDSRRATEQVIATYGPDALIISNQRVNGMTELVVAIDTDEPTSTPESVNLADSIKPSKLAPSRKTDGFGRTLLSSLDPHRGSTRPAATVPGAAGAIGAAPEEEPRHVPPFLRGAAQVERAEEAVAQTLADTRYGGPDQSDPDESAQSADTGCGRSAPHVSFDSHDQPKSGAPRSRTNQLDDPDTQVLDSLRARELVDLVRAELASMRHEIALSRHAEAYPPGGALLPELQPLAGALASASVPAALRILLLDQARDCSDLQSAVETMKHHLAASITSLEQPDRFEGVHVVAGPTGAGKTQMLFRLASRHIAQHGTGSVAVLSFADGRIGAWTQIQMLGARLGIDCFRVTGEELLGPMLEELQPRRLILIDTPGTGFADRLISIQRCSPKARFHLVVPADASASSISRFITTESVAWHSVMVSKLDESVYLWPLIQALCNHSLPVSLCSSSGSAESSASALSPADLVRAAFDTLELPVKPATRSRTPRKAPARTRREERHAA